MGRKFYCDVCNTSFPYSIEARKKHQRGYQHVNASKIHYHNFKSKYKNLRINIFVPILFFI